MLRELSIQNYALIRELTVNFDKGLTTITGETGTGKSIIIGALGLILGNRADSSSITDNSGKCVIEGRFEIDNYSLEDFFAVNDLDWEATTILRREISSSGKSRAFINDTPVNLNIIKELGEKLIDIHSQHQTSFLSSTAFQIALLDAFCKHKDVLKEFQAGFKKYKNSIKELEKLEKIASDEKKELEFNLFQINEINTIAPVKGEYEQLEAELNILSNAEAIKSGLESVIHNLDDGEINVLSLLGEVKKNISSVSGFSSALSDLSRRIEEVYVELKDIYGEAKSIDHSANLDAPRIEEINTRLQVLSRLFKKHGVRDEDELIEFAEKLNATISSAENIQNEIDNLQKEIKKSEENLTKIAFQLSKNRKGQVIALKENLELLLRKVGIPNAAIKIKLIDTNGLTETGLDKIDILFSANVGVEPGSLNNVASGGELSRLMLCFKYILADTVFLPTIIFDEIDSGISGEVAIQVGKLIKKLSESHQVITITHQPQVAAKGDHQFTVFKISGEEFTQTEIKQLSQEQRVEEIARMIGGYKLSSVSMESARELLES